MRNPPSIVRVTHFPSDDESGQRANRVRVSGVGLRGVPDTLLGEYANSHTAADWLRKHDYAYITGTDGLWYRKETK